MVYVALLCCCLLFAILIHETHSNFPEDINQEFDDEDGEYYVPTRLEKESYKKYKYKGSKEENDEALMKDFLNIFEQTIDHVKEEKIKKTLTIDEYSVRISAMMKQAYARIKQTPVANILYYNSLDDDDPQLPLPGDPNFEYDEEIIEEAIARHRRKMRYGTEFPHNDNPATPENPLIFSPKKYGQYELVIWDYGDTNEHYLPAHMYGILELVKDGRGLDDDKTKKLEIAINIPKLGLRCCDTTLDLAQINAKYLSDYRSLHFKITTKNKLVVDGKFFVKYECKRDIDGDFRVGHFEYKLEIKNAKLKSIDYTKMQAIEKYNWKKGERIQHGNLFEEDHASEQSVKLEYPADTLSSFPPKPKSMKGIIIAKFVPIQTKQKSRSSNKQPDLKINLGSPASPANPKRIPLDTINSSSEKSFKNVSKHDEL